MWGRSAGGQFNYEFVAWKPERVLAFVVNKGGIYYSALLPKAAREVPGMLFIGGKDLAFRNNTIAGLFAVNRRGGALWAGMAIACHGTAGFRNCAATLRAVRKRKRPAGRSQLADFAPERCRYLRTFPLPPRALPPAPPLPPPPDCFTLPPPPPPPPDADLAAPPDEALGARLGATRIDG